MFPAIIKALLLRPISLRWLPAATSTSESTWGFQQEAGPKGFVWCGAGDLRKGRLQAQHVLLTGGLIQRLLLSSLSFHEYVWGTMSQHVVGSRLLFVHGHLSFLSIG